MSVFKWDLFWLKPDLFCRFSLYIPRPNPCQIYPKSLSQNYERQD